MSTQESVRSADQSLSLIRFFLFSAFGIFMFFIPVSFAGKSSIPIDHIVTMAKTHLASAIPVYILTVVTLGAAWPFIKGTWKATPTSLFFSVAKVIGTILAFMVYFKAAPDWMLEKDMGPFLYNALLVSVGLIVPIGSVFLSFLVGYGFLEFCGVLMQPVMRPFFRTPGRSSLDAVASFVGSYSVGLLITNKLYMAGKYNAREALIIATGFSTVSATFMVIIAKTLGLMDMWNFYFWSTMIITFAVTAITARIYPVSRAPATYYEGAGNEEPLYKGNLFAVAFKEGTRAAMGAQSLLSNVLENLRDGLLMTMSILPTGMSLAMLGLVLSKYTSFFDVVGYLFYPVLALFDVPEALLAAKASALTMAECFIPTLLVTKSALVTRYVVGVTCVSSIIFFAATVPCILGTKIPVSLVDLVVIWIERVLLSLLLACCVAVFIL